MPRIASAINKSVNKGSGEMGKVLVRNRTRLEIREIRLGWKGLGAGEKKDAECVAVEVQKKKVDNIKRRRDHGGTSTRTATKKYWPVSTLPLGPPKPFEDIHLQRNNQRHLDNLKQPSSSSQQKEKKKHQARGKKEVRRTKQQLVVSEPLFFPITPPQLTLDLDRVNPYSLNDDGSVDEELGQEEEELLPFSSTSSWVKQAEEEEEVERASSSSLLGLSYMQPRPTATIIEAGPLLSTTVPLDQLGPSFLDADLFYNPWSRSSPPSTCFSSHQTLKIPSCSHSREVHYSSDSIASRSPSYEKFIFQDEKEDHDGKSESDASLASDF